MIVNLAILELFYRFETLLNDYCFNEVKVGKKFNLQFEIICYYLFFMILHN